MNPPRSVWKKSFFIALIIAPPALAQLSGNAGSLFVGRDPSVETWGGINIRATASTSMLPHIPGDELIDSPNFQNVQTQITPLGVVANQEIYIFAEPATKLPDFGSVNDNPTYKDKSYMFASFHYVVGNANTPDQLDLTYLAEISAEHALGLNNSGDMVPVDMAGSASLILTANFSGFPSTEEPGRLVLDPIPLLFDSPGQFETTLNVDLRVYGSNGVEFPEFRGYWNNEDPLNSTSNPESPITIDFDRGFAYVLSVNYAMRVQHGFDPIENIQFGANAGIPLPIPEPGAGAMLVLCGGLLLLKRRV